MYAQAGIKFPIHMELAFLKCNGWISSKRRWAVKEKDGMHRIAALASPNFRLGISVCHVLSIFFG